LLIVVVLVCIAIVIVQVAVPGVVSVVLRRTPPVTVVANIVEITIVVAVASRET
jgi:hypothetical protein